jgi:hypothetical protein
MKKLPLNFENACFDINLGQSEKTYEFHLRSKLSKNKKTTK